MRKDKAKVIDEVWTEERVRSFLDILAPNGIDPDYHRLLRSYRSMRASDFELFLGFFTEAGLNINALSPQGETILDMISRHRHCGDYVQALSASGAKHKKDLS